MKQITVQELDEMLRKLGKGITEKDWKSAIVDGVTLKPDTWYKLENGEFVEVKDGGEE